MSSGAKRNDAATTCYVIFLLAGNLNRTEKTLTLNSKLSEAKTHKADFTNFTQNPNKTKAEPERKLKPPQPLI